MKYLSLYFVFILVSCFSKNNSNLKEQVLNTELSGTNFDTTGLKKTSEMIDENKFWGLIDNSLKNTTNQEEQEKFLIKEIFKLTPKEIIGFRLRTDKLLFDTYNSKMCCAGYIMNGGCSDDGFEYFRNWIISRGKNTYYKAKENPDNLINQVNQNIDIYEFESFWYVANEAFRQKTNKDLYNYIDDEKFKTNEANYTKFEFDWKENDPKSMKTLCPNLSKKFHTN